MAFANPAWADSPPKRYALLRPARRASALGLFGNAAVLAACATAALAIFHPAGISDSIAPAGPSQALLALRNALPGEAAHLLLERNVETFLADSLELVRPCATACASRDAELTEARKLGRFGAAPAGLPLPSGLPLGERFAPQPAPAPVETQPRAVVPALPARPPTATPPTIRVTPSVLLPLSPEMARRGAPAPLPRPDRPTDSATALAMPAEPMADASVPLGDRAPGPVAPLQPARNDGVAIYDISAATVYMPDGARLEAHSGLGRMVDNPRYVDRKNTGPTPPGTYDLVMRKGRFHGVEALRLIPVDGKNKFGRDGLLTHTYLLRGRPGESNGCVVFPNYASFLNAFKRGHVKQLVVVASLKTVPTRLASAK
jgi:hypothetical protein